MGASTGNYSRDLYDIYKQHVYTRYQQGKILVDADMNEDSRIHYEIFRQALMVIMGNSGTGFFDDAFKIIQSPSSTTRNFVVTYGLAFVSGHPAILEQDKSLVVLDYVPNAGGTAITKYRRRMHSVVTAASYSGGVTTITDSSQNWPVGALAGANARYAVLDLSNVSATTHVITGNTANSFTIAGDVTSEVTVGDNYMLLITPGFSRTDTVWLNVYVDEIDSTDDTDLEHPIKSGYESARRARLRTIIETEEDTAGGTSYSQSYTDSDGNPHYRVKLADLLMNNNDVLTADITDQRTEATELIHTLSDHTDVSVDEAAAFNAMRSPTSTNHVVTVNDAAHMLMERLQLDIGYQGMTQSNTYVTIRGGLTCAVYNAAMPIDAVQIVPATQSQTFTSFYQVRVSTPIYPQITASGLNGMEPGTALSNNTWYVLYLLYDPTSGTIASVFSASFDEPTRTGFTQYTHWRRLGMVYHTTGGALALARKRGDIITYSGTMPISVPTPSSPGYVGEYSINNTTWTSVNFLGVVQRRFVNFAHVQCWRTGTGPAGECMVLWGRVTSTPVESNCSGILNGTLTSNESQAGGWVDLVTQVGFGDSPACNFALTSPVSSTNLHFRIDQYIEMT